MKMRWECRALGILSGFLGGCHVCKCETNFFAKPQQILRVEGNKFSTEEFNEHFVKPSTPVIFNGMTKQWKINDYLSREKLVEAFPDLLFSVKIESKAYGEDVCEDMDLDTFYRKNDSGNGEPLYLFHFLEPGHPFLELYDVPEIFQEDVFDMLPIDQRPAWRWFVLGLENSGSSMHIDPNATQAWNALLKGEKRWVLIPNLNREMIEKTAKQTAEEFFQTTYHELREQGVEMYETMQMPGETIFVPAGWHHVVLNCSETIAVTQNRLFFCQ